MPSQVCFFDTHCKDLCNNLGYNRGLCQIRWSHLTLNKPLRSCSCYECDSMKCISYCNKKLLKFTGCMCYNLLIPGGPIVENILHKNHINECSDERMFCQCSA
jgi:hypothetical protein